MQKTALLGAANTLNFLFLKMMVRGWEFHSDITVEIFDFFDHMTFEDPYYQAFYDEALDELTQGTYTHKKTEGEMLAALYELLEEHNYDSSEFAWQFYEKLIKDCYKNKA